MRKPLAIFISYCLLSSFSFDVDGSHSSDTTSQLWTHNHEIQKRSYKNYKLLRINPRTEEALEYLRELFHTQMPPYELDFWQPPSHPGGLVDVTVAPEDSHHFYRELDTRQIDFFVAIEDLEDVIQHESMSSNYDQQGDQPVEPDFIYRYDRYNPLTLIEKQLQMLRDDNRKIMTLLDIGKSHENRTIYVVKITARQRATIEEVRPERAPSIWIDAGIHAREWIAPATAMNLIKTLVNGYNSNDEHIRYLVEGLDWYITVVLNPDGYEYSHTKNRMWRKNRRPALCKKLYLNRICCAGVDLNRNFDWHWASSGSSSDPCHETYHGPSAFSEPESKAVKNFLERYPVRAFITLHSYSQLWLLPFGHAKGTYPSDYSSVLRPISVKATKALSEMFGSKYTVGTGADLLYEASGASHDWAKGTINTPYSFLVELRPQNTLFNSGFLLPESEILATGQETWAALKVVADEVLEKYGRPNGRKLVKTPLPTKLTTTTTTTTMTATTTTFARTSPRTSSSTSTEPVITRRNLVTSRRTFAPISRVKTTTPCPPLLPPLLPVTPPGLFLKC